MEAQERWYEENPDSTDSPDFPPDPSVQIEVPAWMTRGPNPDGSSPYTPEELALMEAQTKLYEVLYEAQNDYYESKAEDG